MTFRVDWVFFIKDQSVQLFRNFSPVFIHPSIQPSPYSPSILHSLYSPIHSFIHSFTLAHKG